MGEVWVAFQLTGIKHSKTPPRMCKAQQKLWMPTLISCFIAEGLLHFLLFMKFSPIRFDDFLMTNSSMELAKMFQLNKSSS